MRIQEPDTRDDIEIRDVTPDQFEPFFAAISRAFGGEPSTPEQIASAVEHADGVHFLAAWDGEHIVGTSGWYPLSLTVPGGTRIPACGVTAVTVAATHKRRGLLTRMLTGILHGAAERGDPVSILLASEGAIYGRFGYGVGTMGVRVQIDVRRAELLRGSPPAGSLSYLQLEELDELAPSVYTAASGARAGGVDRPAGIWARNRVSRKPGREQAVLYRAPDGSPEGYVTYSIRNNWDTGSPNHGLELSEMVTATDRATEALWRHCLNVDLVGEVSAFWRPIDDPVRWMLRDPRMMRTTMLTDVLWVRPLDPVALLETRTYSRDGRIVLKFDDPVLDRTATVSLEVSGGQGRCSAVAAEPDLVMGVAELGSIYLGGVGAAELASARRIEETRPGALAEADALFAHRPLPWAQTMF